jgi:hypothetical protein
MLRVGGADGGDVAPRDDHSESDPPEHPASVATRISCDDLSVSRPLLTSDSRGAFEDRVARLRLGA